MPLGLSGFVGRNTGDARRSGGFERSSGIGGRGGEDESGASYHDVWKARGKVRKDFRQEELKKRKDMLGTIKHDFKERNWSDGIQKLYDERLAKEMRGAEKLPEGSKTIKRKQQQAEKKARLAVRDAQRKAEREAVYRIKKESRQALAEKFEEINKADRDVRQAL